MLLRRAAVAPVPPREGETLRADMRLRQELDEDGSRAAPWVGMEDRRLLLHPHGQVLVQAQVAINAIVRAENEEGVRVTLRRDKQSGEWVADGPTAEGLHEEMPESLEDARHLEQGDNLRAAVEACLSSAVAVLPLLSEPQHLALTWVPPPSNGATEQVDFEEGPACFCNCAADGPLSFAVHASSAYGFGEWPQPMWLQEEAAWQQLEREEAQSGRAEAGPGGEVLWVLGEMWCGGWSEEVRQEEAASSWSGVWSQGAWSEGWAQPTEPPEPTLQWASPEQLQRIRDEHLRWVAGDDE